MQFAVCAVLIGSFLRFSPYLQKRDGHRGA
jgi:hypothetical protein